MSKKHLVVLFGGKSTEHEVSVITALQAIENLDRNKYDITPIYVTKSGKWILGDRSFFSPYTFQNPQKLESNFPHVNISLGIKPQLKSSKILHKLPEADVVFPIFHGTFGEDGCVQGLLELLNLPYVGCGVLASSIGMDKILQKEVFATHKLPQVRYQWFYKSDWQKSPVQIMKNIQYLKFPLFIKPCNGGSSVGISKAKNKAELKNAIDVACFYDRKIIVEKSAEGFMEINISVMGNSGSFLQTSICEFVPSKGLLSYEDKYMSKGNKVGLKNAGMASGSHILPAPLKKITSQKIAELAKKAFSAIDGSGFTRADFLVSKDEKTIYINELNTIPGSLAHFLWTHSGMTYSQYLDKLIELAFEKFAEKSANTFSFNSNILSNLSEVTKGKLKL